MVAMLRRFENSISRITSGIRKNLFLFMIFLIPVLSSAEDRNLNHSVRLLYRGDETSSLELMNAALSDISGRIKNNQAAADLWLLTYYAGLAEYRIASYYQYEKKEDGTAFKHLELSINYLQKSKELKKDFPENYALISSCYGSMLSMSPWKGFYLGPMAGKEMNAAVTLGRKNPRVWLLKGIGTFYTPETFGGGKDKAIRELKIAERLFTENTVIDSGILPSWGYEEVYIWLGNFYKDKGDLNSALVQYEKALKIKPDHAWVRKNLLPDLMVEINRKDKK
jgi:tetratricopeptide (TPR) repeat protein